MTKGLNSMGLKVFDNYKKNVLLYAGSIGGKIKKIRQLRGYSQRQLGLLCNFSEASAEVRIAQYEMNKKIPREDTLRDIANALGVSEYAFFETNVMSRDRMYHVLFDLEDFYGLRPVKIGDNYYLEFGDKTAFDQKFDPFENQDFLRVWHEKYTQNLPRYADTAEKAEKKATEYTLWRYEYPNDNAKESLQKLRNKKKMDQLQAEIDRLYAEMQSESELAKLDVAIEKDLCEARNNYKPITKASELVLFIEDMLLAEVQAECVSSELNVVTENSSDYFPILSFRTADIINQDVDHNMTRYFYVLFLLHIETMQKNGLIIRKKITARDKELYITHEIAASQYKYVEMVSEYWDDINEIRINLSIGNIESFNDLDRQLRANITGENDVELKTGD